MADTESVLIDDKFFQVIRGDSGKIRIFINTPKFTLIPSELYSADLREHYLRFSNGLNTDEVIIENQIQKGNYYLLFPIKHDLKHSLELKFPDSEIYHFATVLASRLLDEGQTDGPSVLINKQDNNFYLVIRKNNNIVLLNSYAIKKDDDLIYFTLNGLRECELDPKYAKVFYSGNISQGEKIISILRKYVLTLTEVPQTVSKRENNCLYNSFQFNQTIE